MRSRGGKAGPHRVPVEPELVHKAAGQSCVLVEQSREYVVGGGTGVGSRPGPPFRPPKDLPQPGRKGGRWDRLAQPGLGVEGALRGRDRHLEGGEPERWLARNKARSM